MNLCILDKRLFFDMNQNYLAWIKTFLDFLFWPGIFIFEKILEINLIISWNWYQEKKPPKKTSRKGLGLGLRSGFFSGGGGGGLQSHNFENWNKRNNQKTFDLKKIMHKVNYFVLLITSGWVENQRGIFACKCVCISMNGCGKICQVLGKMTEYILIQFFRQWTDPTSMVDRFTLRFYLYFKRLYM